MLKNKRILLTILVALLLLLVPSIVNAADGEVNMTSIEVTTPSGIYGAGQEVTIRVNFDKAVKGNMPKLQIYFGNGDNKELTVSEVTTPVNYVDYTYTIASGDNGELKLYGPSISNDLYNELGNALTVNGIFELSGNIFIAETTTITRGNFENAEFVWHKAEEYNHIVLDLKVKNATTINLYDYYVHFSHNKNEQLNVLDYKNDAIWTNEINTYDENTIYYASDEILEENGDVYVWICEVDNLHRIPKMVVNAKKIERLPQLPLGKRLEAFFFDERTSTHCWEPHSGIERKVNVKIGMITDISILKAIKNGEANALQRLLDYSKTAEAFYTGTVLLGGDDSIVKNLHIINNEYYYVYLQLDDENGKYYPVEDVSLYQGCVGENVGTNLFNYLDDGFTWNLDEEAGNNPTPAPAPTPEPEKKPAKTEDKTKAPGSLPYTGGTLVIIVSVLAIIALGIYAYRRNNDLKGI